MSGCIEEWIDVWMGGGRVNGCVDEWMESWIADL